MEKLAVFTDMNGELEGFYDCTRIIQYSYSETGIVKEVEFEFDQIEITNAGDIREQIKNLIPLLGDCNVIVVKEIAGMAYSVFDRAGYMIFTVEDYTLVTLEGIIKDIHEDKERQAKEAENFLRSPIEGKESGIYYFDLSKAMEENPDTTSKKLLSGFLANTPFMELHLICDHIPPWIERNEKLEVKKSSSEDKLAVVITPAKTKSCFI